MGAENVLDDGAHLGQCEPAMLTFGSFALPEGVRQRGQDHVAVPPGQRSPFEMIECQVVLEFLILLLDGRPALMRQLREGPQRGGRRQMDDVVLGARLAPRSRSANSPTLGAKRRSRQSWAGVTLSARRDACREGFPPLR